jgi:hypothetical protein
VLTCRKLSAAMVEPMARPRKMVVTLAISLLAASARRGTTSDSRSRLPNINMPTSGVAMGTNSPVARVTTMGKSTRTGRPTGREV